MIANRSLAECQWLLSRLKLNRQEHRVEAPVGSQAHAHKNSARRHTADVFEGFGGGGVKAAESHIFTLVIGSGGLNESEEGLLRAACGKRDVPLRAPSGILMCAGGERPQQGA